MLDTLFQNLIYLGIGAGLLAVSYVSNLCFSLYYNIRQLHQAFDKDRFIDGILKLLTFVVGTVLLCTGITLMPLFLQETGITVSETYTSAISVIAIISLFLTTAAKYMKEAYDTLVRILNEERETPDETSEEVG